MKYFLPSNYCRLKKHHKVLALFARNHDPCAFQDPSMLIIGCKLPPILGLFWKSAACDYLKHIANPRCFLSFPLDGE